MKKIFTLVFGLLAGMATATAQTSVEFVDALTGGNIVADGSEITVTAVEKVSGTDQDMLRSGLYVTNNSSDVIGISVECDIKLPEGNGGTHQICFPSACTQQTSSQLYATPQGTIMAGSVSDLQAEWLPNEYGECTVTYQIKIYSVTQLTKPPFISYEFKENGPKVTVHYKYLDPAGLNTLENNAQSITFFDLAGRKVANPQNGVFLKKVVLANGKSSVHKVVLKK